MEPNAFQLWTTSKNIFHYHIKTFFFLTKIKKHILRPLSINIKHTPKLPASKRNCGTFLHEDSFLKFTKKQFNNTLTNVF